MSRHRHARHPRFRPPTDILEKEDGYYLYLDLPGVAREDLVLDLKDSELVVRANSVYRDAPGEKYMEVEFGQAEYTRTFTLSEAVDREGIRASLINGVLEIFLPRSRDAGPRRITVRGA